MVRRRRIQTSSRITPRISLTPLIDTVLVLLVIFMVAAPLTYRLLRLDLPQSYSDEKTKKASHDIIEVHIDKNKNISINNILINQKDLIQTLEKITEPIEKPIVIIHADEMLSYKEFIELIVDYIKQVGKIRHVFVATQPKLKG